MAKLDPSSYDSFIMKLALSRKPFGTLLPDISIQAVSQQGGDLMPKPLDPVFYNAPAVANAFFQQTEYQCVRRLPQVAPGQEYFSSGMTTVSASTIRTICQFIGTLSYAKTVYDNVVDNVLWRSLYDIRKRQIPCKTTTGEQNLETLSFFCHLCGFLHPFGCISIDHYVPKSIKNHTAFYRVMRHLGYTVGAPKGHFGKQIHGLANVANFAFSAPTTGKHVVAATPDPVLGELSGAAYLGSMRAQAQNHTDTTQYTLTAQGLVIAAVLHHIYDTTLARACTHSMLNLRPVCSSCNSSKNASFQKSLP